MIVRDIIEVFNRTRFRGFDNWVDAGTALVGSDGSETVSIIYRRAANEAEAIIAEEERQSSALARVMPFLREFAEIAEVSPYLMKKDVGEHVWDQRCGVTFADVAALVEDFDA